MQIDPGVLVTAAAAVVTTIVMVVSLRYQVRKDAAARQDALQKEIRRLVAESETRHQETIEGMRREITTLHSRIDRKEADYKKADRDLSGDVKEVIRGVAALEGAAAQICDQVKLIQRITSERP